MRAARCIITWTLLALSSVATTPDWVRGLGSGPGYPRSRYFTGFGISGMHDSLTLGGCIERARDLARADLAGSLRSTITAEQVSGQLVHEGNISRNRVADHYSTTVTSAVSMELDGVETALHYDEAAKTVYALAYLDKERAAAAARFRMRANLALLPSDSAIAREALPAAGEAVAAIRRDVSLLHLCGAGALLTDDEVRRIAFVTRSLSELDTWVPRTVHDLAASLARRLKERMGALPGQSVIVNGPSYGATYWYSHFSIELQRDLEWETSETMRLTPVHGSTLSRLPPSRSAAFRKALEERSRYLILSDYVIDSAQTLLCRVSLFDASSQRTLGSAVSSMYLVKSDTAWLAPGEPATHDLAAWAEGDGSLGLSVTTNHGTDNIIAAEGELLLVYVRCSKPCYLQFTSMLGDGTVVVPGIKYQNYYLGEHLVNRTIVLPDSFRVGRPLGSETLRFTASTRPFEELELSPLRLDGTMHLQVTGTRGPAGRFVRGVLTKPYDHSEITRKTIRMVTLPRSSE